MKIHELKVSDEFEEDLFMGVKTFEIRLNDREFQVGDILILKIYNMVTMEYKYPPLDEFYYNVTYILTGEKWGLKPNYCIMSIEVNPSLNRDTLLQYAYKPITRRF